MYTQMYLCITHIMNISIPFGQKPFLILQRARGPTSSAFALPTGSKKSCDVDST